MFIIYLLNLHATRLVSNNSSNDVVLLLPQPIINAISACVFLFYTKIGIVKLMWIQMLMCGLPVAQAPAPSSANAQRQEHSVI